MGKLIHCKDNLEKREEILARRTKDLLLKRDPETVMKLKQYAKTWLKAPTQPFERFLMSKDRIFGSAYKRAKELGWKWK